MINSVYNWILSLCVNRKPGAGNKLLAKLLQFEFYKKVVLVSDTLRDNRACRDF